MFVSLGTVPLWAWVLLTLGFAMLTALVGFEFTVRAINLRKLREQRDQHRIELTEWNARHGAIFTDAGVRVGAPGDSNLHTP